MRSKNFLPNFAGRSNEGDSRRKRQSADSILDRYTFFIYTCPDGRTERLEIIRGIISARGQTAVVDRHPEITEERSSQYLEFERYMRSLFALARMAELVDALVSNTSSFLECRFDPGSGYKKKSSEIFRAFLINMTAMFSLYVWISNVLIEIHYSCYP